MWECAKSLRTMGTQAGKAKQSKAGQDTTGQDREKGHYHTSKPA